MTKQWILDWKHMSKQDKLNYAEQYMVNGHLKDMTPKEVAKLFNKLTQAS